MRIVVSRRGSTRDHFTLWDAVAELTGADPEKPGFFRRASLRRMVVSQLFDRELADTLYELTPAKRAQLQELFAVDSKLATMAQKQLDAATDHHVPQGLALALGFSPKSKPAPVAEAPAIRTPVPAQVPTVLSARPALGSGGSGLC